MKNEKFFIGEMDVSSHISTDLGKTLIGETDDATIHDLSQQTMQLAMAALQTGAGLNAWKEVFPGICPGCFGFHRDKIPILTGICVPCRLKMSTIQKQLASQE